MDTGNISRSPNQVTSELELKRLHPVAKVGKKDEANAVLNKPQAEQSDSRKVANDQEKSLNKDELTDIVTKMNGALQDENRTIQFSVDDVSGRTVITVTDSKTGKLITQFPSEEVLEISRNLAEQMNKKDGSSGLLLKKRV